MFHVMLEFGLMGFFWKIVVDVNVEVCDDIDDIYRSRIINID